MFSSMNEAQRGRWKRSAYGEKLTEGGYGG